MKGHALSQRKMNKNYLKFAGIFQKSSDEITNG